MPSSPAPAEKRDQDLIDRLVGRYRVVRVLGEGGMASVYLGQHTVVHAEVAIKVLHEGAGDVVDRFVREARATNAIRSPHIVPIFDFGELEDGRPYAVMEVLRGRPLDAVLAAARPIAPRDGLEIARQVALGMAAAHGAGFLHRDLKPANLFLQTGSRGETLVRILDFGIADTLTSHAKASDTRITKAGFVIGTPQYCSPEQSAGRTLTETSDIYSLGVVLYEAITGAAVYEGNSVEVLVKKNVEPVRHIGEVCPDLAAPVAELIMQMLERDPSARPASMAQVADRLSELLRSTEASSEERRGLAPTLVSGPAGAIDIKVPYARAAHTPLEMSGPPPAARAARGTRRLAVWIGAAVAAAALAVAASAHTPWMAREVTPPDGHLDGPVTVETSQEPVPSPAAIADVVPASRELEQPASSSSTTVDAKAPSASAKVSAHVAAAPSERRLSPRPVSARPPAPPSAKPAAPSKNAAQLVDPFE